MLLASEKLLDVNPRSACLHKHKLDTPLSIAIKEGHKETAELLARADGSNTCLTIDLSINEIHKISVLGLAIRGIFEDVASSLLDKCALSNNFKVARFGRDNYGNMLKRILLNLHRSSWFSLPLLDAARLMLDMDEVRPDVN
jgi:ankyrin repeat protein